MSNKIQETQPSIFWLYRDAFVWFLDTYYSLVIPNGQDGTVEEKKVLEQPSSSKVPLVLGGTPFKLSWFGINGFWMFLESFGSFQNLEPLLGTQAFTASNWFHLLWMYYWNIWVWILFPSGLFMCLLYLSISFMCLVGVWLWMMCSYVFSGLVLKIVVVPGFGCWVLDVVNICVGSAHRCIYHQTTKNRCSQIGALQFEQLWSITSSYFILIWLLLDVTCIFYIYLLLCIILYQYGLVSYIFPWMSTGVPALWSFDKYRGPLWSCCGLHKGYGPGRQNDWRHFFWIMALDNKKFWFYRLPVLVFQETEPSIFWFYRDAFLWFLDTYYSLVIPNGQDGTVEEKKVLEQPPSVKVPLVLGGTPFKLSWFGINGFWMFLESFGSFQNLEPLLGTQAFTASNWFHLLWMYYWNIWVWILFPSGLFMCLLYLSISFMCLVGVWLWMMYSYVFSGLVLKIVVVPGFGCWVLDVVNICVGSAHRCIYHQTTKNRCSQIGALQFEQLWSITSSYFILIWLLLDVTCIFYIYLLLCIILYQYGLVSYIFPWMSTGVPALWSFDKYRGPLWSCCGLHKGYGPGRQNDWRHFFWIMALDNKKFWFYRLPVLVFQETEPNIFWFYRDAFLWFFDTYYSLVIPHGQDGTVEENKVLEQPPSVKVPLVLGGTPFKLSWFGINGFWMFLESFGSFQNLEPLLGTQAFTASNWFHLLWMYYWNIWVWILFPSGLFMCLLYLSISFMCLVGVWLWLMCSYVFSGLVLKIVVVPGFGCWVLDVVNICVGSAHRCIYHQTTKNRCSQIGALQFEQLWSITSSYFILIWLLLDVTCIFYIYLLLCIILYQYGLVSYIFPWMSTGVPALWSFDKYRGPLWSCCGLHKGYGPGRQNDWRHFFWIMALDNKKLWFYRLPVLVFQEAEPNIFWFYRDAFLWFLDTYYSLVIPHGQDGTVEEKKVLEQPPSVKVPLVLGGTLFKLSWFGINGFWMFLKKKKMLDHFRI